MTEERFGALAHSPDNAVEFCLGETVASRFPRSSDGRLRKAKRPYLTRTSTWALSCLEQATPSASGVVINECRSRGLTGANKVHRVAERLFEHGGSFKLDDRGSNGGGTADVVAFLIQESP